MVKLKVEAIRTIKILAILFTISLIGCFASTRSSNTHSDPDGFRGIKWGTGINALKDLEKVEQDKSSDGDLVWYTRNGDTLAIGEAKLENIFYSFWMGDFGGAWIDFKGDGNFEALRKELIEQFGKPLEFEGSMNEMGKRAGIERSPTERAGAFYVWWGKNTEVWLSYSKDRYKGTLSINSKKLREERRSYEEQRKKKTG